MTIKDWEEKVDKWIKDIGVRYFDVMTNTLILNEEVGELSSLIARKYGEQSFKKKEDELSVDENIADEIGDILFVLTCLSNQMGYSLEDIVQKNIEKKTKRDITRHRQNVKLH